MDSEEHVWNVGVDGEFESECRHVHQRREPSSRILQDDGEGSECESFRDSDVDIFGDWKESNVSR